MRPAVLHRDENRETEVERRLGPRSDWPPTKCRFFVGMALVLAGCDSTPDGAGAGPSTTSVSVAEASASRPPVDREPPMPLAQAVDAAERCIMQADAEVLRQRYVIGVEVGVSGAATAKVTPPWLDPKAQTCFQEALRRVRPADGRHEEVAVDWGTCDRKCTGDPLCIACQR